MSDLYVYKISSIERIVDGDTYDLHVDVGFHATFASRFRLRGWDTPELRRGSEFEKQSAVSATRFVERWFEVERLDQYRIRTHKSDSFGRWLCDIWRSGSTSDLGEALHRADLATPWPTRWRDVFDKEDRE